MSSTNSVVKFRSGTYAAFLAAAKNENTIYFCTDTKQLFVGTTEYTKGAAVLEYAPEATTPGDDGRIYAYNGNLYLCQYIDGTLYNWMRIGNVNDKQGTVTSVTAGEGLTTSAGASSAITSAGTIVHAVPEGAEEHNTEESEQAPGFGETVVVPAVATDKFGHAIGFYNQQIKIPDSPIPKEISVDYNEQTDTVTFS